jgi:hypothetical protein
MPLIVSAATPTFFAPRKSKSIKSNRPTIFDTPPTSPTEEATIRRLFVTSRQKVGRYVEYLVEYHHRDHQPPQTTWKRISELTDREKEAKQAFLQQEKRHRETVQHVAQELAESAHRGNMQIEVPESISSHPDFESFLSEALNQATIRKDTDIGDWGNVKNTMYWYEDTLLMSAARRGDVNGVEALLVTGLCDPTLKTTTWSCFDGYTAPKTSIYTALDLARKHAPHKMVEALLEAALTMWPEASYSSPEAGYRDIRKEEKYWSRMHGVQDGHSFLEVRETLQLKLVAARRHAAGEA